MKPFVFIFIFLFFATNSISQNISEGKRLLRQREFEKAIAIFEAIIKGQPNNADAHNDLGEALYELERYEEAITAFEKAIAINNHSRARVNLEVARWAVPQEIAMRERIEGRSEFFLQIGSGYLSGVATGMIVWIGMTLIGLQDSDLTVPSAICLGMAVGGSSQVHQTGEYWGYGGASIINTTAGAILPIFVGALIANSKPNRTTHDVLIGGTYGSILSPITAAIGYQISKRKNIFGFFSRSSQIRTDFGSDQIIIRAIKRF